MVLFVSLFDNSMSKDTCFVGKKKKKSQIKIVTGLFVGYIVIQVYLLQ